jgi:hypothetical protein
VWWSFRVALKATATEYKVLLVLDDKNARMCCPHDAEVKVKMIRMMSQRMFVYEI